MPKIQEEIKGIKAKILEKVILKIIKPSKFLSFLKKDKTNINLIDITSITFSAYDLYDESYAYTKKCNKYMNLIIIKTKDKHIYYYKIKKDSLLEELRKSVLNSYDVEMKSNFAGSICFYGIKKKSSNLIFIEYKNIFFKETLSIIKIDSVKAEKKLKILYLKNNPNYFKNKIVISIFNNNKKINILSPTKIEDSRNYTVYLFYKDGKILISMRSIK